MKKSIIAATALLIPAALFAEVQINFNVNAYTTSQLTSDNDNDEWFEDAGSDGSAKLNLEYQWSTNNGKRILQYRKVSFSPITGAWAFGIWMTKDEYCHTSCNIHHKHHFYHRTTCAPQWRHEYSRQDNRHHYYYDKRYKEPVREYHEYYPHIRNEHSGRGIERVVEKHYYKQDKSDCNYKVNINEKRRNPYQQYNHLKKQDHQYQDNFQTQRDHRGDRQPMIRVTERERIIR